MIEIAINVFSGAIIGFCCGFLIGAKWGRLSKLSEVDEQPTKE